MAKLGFLGLGLMGYPMARNLLKAGHEVALWSHNAEKARKLAAEEGGTYCETPREVGEKADCIFLCVGDTAMAREVILGEDGIAQGARPGTIVADATTIGVSTSRAIGEELAQNGIRYMDIPCTGSTGGAQNGTLTFMIGGDQEVFEAIRPYLEIMGKRLYYCGGAGMGLQAKLAQNLVLSNIMSAFCEGMVLATKGGIDPQLMLDILDNSAAKSGLIAYKAPFVFRRDFTPNFSVKWMHKDIGLILECGQELGVPLYLTSVARQFFQTAITAGHGEEDMCATIKVLEELTGIEVRPEAAAGGAA